MNATLDTEAAPVTVKKLPVAILKTHPEVQREFDRKHADDLALHWDDNLAGQLAVMPAPDGQNYWVVDGQHRVAAMRSPEVAKREAWCVIHHNVTTLPEAAHLQHGLGHVKLWKPIDRFKLRIKKGEPTGLAIAEILNAHGTQISLVPRYGYGCVTQLEKLYEWGPRVLNRTIDTIERAWGSTVPQGRTASVVVALGYFWLQFPNADFERLVARLQRLSLASTVRAARDAALGTSRSSMIELAISFHRHYNTNLQSRRLPEFNPWVVRLRNVTKKI